jgi:aspartyl-tRNA(Asn)/glutamyl-tRNA(Gln) amidotransferase subunit B
MKEIAYTTIIGLEVHVQLDTHSKLFCRCSTKFGESPNTQTCPVCSGQPGALPVMNRRAFELAMRAALALDCEIPQFTKWDRKNYFYPDLPKGFQTSQFDLPMSQNGYLEISDPAGQFENKRVGIIRAHLEEDAGKSLHDEATGKADSRIDLNRCGTPLLEIVSQPDLRAPAEARVYLSELKLLLTYLDVSDCNMQEGSLRVDANVNLHIEQEADTIATPIVEVKNMNSFRAVQRALEYEVNRQFELWQETGRKLGDPGVTKETRGWEDEAQLTRPQRSKEESSDYRYFPEPDLLPVTVTAEAIEEARADLGELPAALRTRLQSQYQISAYDADVLVNQGRQLAEYFMEVAEGCEDGKMASNWVQQDVLRHLKETGKGIEEFSLTASQLAELLSTVCSGSLTTDRAREVFSHMIAQGASVAEAMCQLGIEEVGASELTDLCRELLAANPKIVADIKEGKTKAAGALVGQAKRKNPNVNPHEVQRICLQLAVEM